MPSRTAPSLAQAHCTKAIGSFLRVKRPKRGADHKPPSSVGLRIGWICSSAFPLCLHGRVIGLPSQHLRGIQTMCVRMLIKWWKIVLL